MNARGALVLPGAVVGNYWTTAIKMFDFTNSSIELVFLWRVVRQSHTDVTSLHMHFKTMGRGLLQEGFQSKGECFVCQKRGVKIRKEILENAGEHRSSLNK